MKRALHTILALVALFVAAEVVAQNTTAEKRVQLADPFILLHEGTYYAYGTHNPHGIEYYISNDLKNWLKFTSPINSPPLLLNLLILQVL